MSIRREGHTAVTVRHNFETAHRLPFLGGKCENLHGHSWWATIEVSGPVSSDGILVEYGALKAALRGWIDEHLDHGTMLGDMDPLALSPTARGMLGKVYVFGEEEHTLERRVTSTPYARPALPWPTVENVALLLARMTAAVLVEQRLDAQVTRVEVSETHVNQAVWTA